MIQLPVEIWIQIVHLATAVPSELNTEAASLLERSSVYDARKARAIALHTRRALPRVSCLFYLIANERLYHSITLTRSTQIDRLLHTICDKEASFDSPMRHRQWIRRLDVAQDRRKRTRMNSGLCQLLKELPQLEMLVVSGAYWDYTSGYDLLDCVSRFNRNIKSIGIPYDSFNDSGKYADSLGTTWRSFRPHSLISQCVNASNIPNQREFDGGEFRIMLTPSEPAFAAYGNPACFPRLRTLALLIVTRPLEAFLQTHGHKVTTIDVGTASWTEVTPTIMNNFPNLQNVILDISCLHISKSSNSYIENMRKKVLDNKAPIVDCVGVTVLRNQAPHWNFTEAFSLIPQIFTKVKHVRILEKPIVDILQKQTGRLRQWHASFTCKGIRLEREDGELLISG